MPALRAEPHATVAPECSGPSAHPSYPAVEDAIWQGVREALLGKDVEEALQNTEEAARQAAKD